MAIDKILGNNDLDKVADSVFSAVNDSVSEIKAMQKRKAAENVQIVVQALKKIEADLRGEYSDVADKLAERIASIKDGQNGRNGADGRNGKDGRPGRDGSQGAKGNDGLPGRDGVDGTDGVSVTNAFIDFDGSLIIDLSNGQSLNVGEVVAPDLAEKIKVINTMSTNSAVVINDEGVTISPGVKSLNFVGATVTATASGDDVTVNVSAGTGSVTSVNVTGGTTGLTTTGGPVTTSGTIALGGTLAPSNGGTGLTSLGAGVATFLATPSSANLAAAVTDETAPGALVFGTDLAAPDGAALVGNTPAGTIAATTVQGAIDEIVSDLAASSGSSLVGYAQGGSGAVPRTVDGKLKETVSIKDFGAVGDGVADDTAAVQAAINSEQPLDWGGLTYKITAGVSRFYTKDVFWQGRNATIVYAGTHRERAVLLQGGGIEYVLNDITVDGGKLCNKCLEIDNNTDSYSNLTCNNVFVTRAKRINTFSGGDGLLVRGSFYSVIFNGGGASDCELPAGQGTSGSVGIAGITVTWYSLTRYVHAMYVNNARIEKIFSSDLAYQDDQDGIKYFAPTDGTRKVSSLFSCIASEFENCYGRSIKTQCRDTVVQASSFTRTEGLTSGRGSGEVDAQTGNGNFRDLMFSYSNGQQPGACANVSGSLGTPGISVDGCSVVLDTATTLDNFVSTFPSNNLFSRHTVSNNKVFGKVKSFFTFRCNGNKNFADVFNNYVQEIVDGETSQKALVYATTSGSTTPFFANVTAYSNVYDGADLPAIVRDQIAGNAIFSSLSAWGNHGFANDLNINSTAGGLKTNQVARLGKITGNQGGGAYFEVISKIIASNATETFDVANTSGCLLLIQAGFNNSAYALIASSESANAVIAKGTSFEVGNTTEPATGVFRMYSSGTKQISIKNTNASSRTVAVFVMSPF